MCRRRMLALPFVAALGCAPEEPWFGGEPLGCPNDEQQPVIVTGGLDAPAGLAPLDGAGCVDGAEPHPALADDCADATGPCACRWICEPGCGDLEICTEAHQCTCDPAYQPGWFGCTWRGLLDNGGFDRCDDWRFITSSGNNPDSMTADIEGGKLVLGVTMPCTVAAAAASIRLPAASEMPDGAALVFEYVATEAVNSDPSTPAIELGLERRFTVAPTDVPQTHRECVRLDAYPRTGTLALVVQRLGACFPEEPVGWELRVDDVRLEPDSGCGEP